MAHRTLRLSPEDKDTLDQAAALSSQSLTSFALGILIEKARSLIAERHTTTLSRRDMKRFFEILEAGEESAPALKTAVRRCRQGRG